MILVLTCLTQCLSEPEPDQFPPNLVHLESSKAAHVEFGQDIMSLTKTKDRMDKGPKLYTMRENTKLSLTSEKKRQKRSRSNRNQQDMP